FLKKCGACERSAPWLLELECCGRHQCGLRARRRRFTPPVQGHDTNAKCVRNFALQFALRRQFICLRQLCRNFHPRVPFPFSHSSLHSTLPMLLPQIFYCALGATKQRVVLCPTTTTIYRAGD